MCSGLSHAHTRTRPLASPLATQLPEGENLATEVAWLCPRYTSTSAGFYHCIGVGIIGASV